MDVLLCTKAPFPTQTIRMQASAAIIATLLTGSGKYPPSSQAAPRALHLNGAGGVQQSLEAYKSLAGQLITGVHVILALK